MRLLMAGSFAAMFNLYVSLTALPVHVVQSGGSLFDAGLVSAVGIFSQIAFRFLFGPMADSRGRRLPLLLGSAAFALAPLGYLIAQSSLAIGAVRALQAIGPAALLGAGSAMAVDLSPPELRATGLGLLSTAKSLGVALATPVALAVAAARGFSAVFWVGFVVGLVGFGAMALLREPTSKEDACPAEQADATSRARWTAVLSPDASKASIASLAVLTVAYGAVLTFVPVYGETIGATHHGPYFTILAVASMGGGLATGALADRFGRVPLLMPVIGLYGAGFALLMYFASPPLAFVSAGLVGAGFLGCFVLFGSIIDDVVGSRHRGLVFAVQENGVDLGMGLGSLVFGALVGVTGYGPGFLLLGVFSIAWAAVVRPWLRRIEAENRRGEEHFRSPTNS